MILHMIGIKNKNFLFKLLLSCLLTLLLIEIGLRLFPVVIPLALLIHFNEKPRVEIADSLRLPMSVSNTVTLERDDQGPELRIYKPFTKITWEIEGVGTEVTAVMDELGFCNAAHSYQQQIDIITLGDSFTACHAVSPEDVWTSQLGQMTGMSTYNLGRIGIGLEEYLQIFKQFGLSKSPRLVIMNIYEGNDFRDAQIYYETSTKSTVSSKKEPLAGDNYLGQHSYALNLFVAIVTTMREVYISRAAKDKVRVNFRYELVFSDETPIAFNPHNVDNDEVYNAKQVAALQLEPGVFEAIDRALQTFVDLSQVYNFIPIVSYTPSAYTAYANNVVFDDSDLQVLMPSFSYAQRQYLADKGEKFGFTFVDLTPSMQAATQIYGSQQLLYYQYDLHLTPLGHQVVAKALVQTLAELNFINGAE